MEPFDAGLLASTIALSIPLLLAATGELISERAGVLNVGLEGMMLVGAFFAFLTASKLDSLLLAVVVGVLAGVVFAALMAVLAIEAGADQIVAGIGINILAAGVTSFGFDEIFGGRPEERLETVEPVAIPGLSALGGVGEALFDQPPLAYLAFLLVPLVSVLLFRTRWGLSVRAAGELPVAAYSAGISIRRVRWIATLTAGALAGLGGAYLSVVDLGLFRPEMSGGRGFLALAAVIFGRWRPWGVLVACLVFGGADALQLRLQPVDSIPGQVWALVAVLSVAYLGHWLVKRRFRTEGYGAGLAAGALIVAGFVLAAVTPDVVLPTQLWLALPFILALLALAGAGGKVRMPTALTVPFRAGA